MEYQNILKERDEEAIKKYGEKYENLKKSWGDNWILDIQMLLEKHWKEGNCKQAQCIENMFTKFCCICSAHNCKNKLFRIINL